ncbi:MAG: hypothetical protein JWN04_5793 [Myxococcaceae bacterium]|nr:hypothetical protein [Myxococcaceae bacterium]
MLRLDWLSWVLGFLMCGVTSLAAAQTDYQSALERALSAHAAGDLAEARTFMEQAHALEPNARTLRGLGIIAHAQGRELDAAALLEQARASRVRPLTPELNGAVEELLTRVYKKLARLTLALEPADSKLLIDAAEPVWHAPHELLLLPGRHQLAVSAAGHLPYALALTLEPGSSEALHVVLAKRGDAPASSVAPERALAVHARTLPVAPRWWTPRVRNAALVGAGAITLTGAVLWLTAWRRFDVLKDACQQRPSGGCSSSEAHQLFDESHVRTYARAATALSALGGTLLVSAVAVSLWQRRQRDRATPSLRLQASGAGLRLDGRF